MNPTNTFFIGNGGIVQLDDVLISMAGNARKSSGGNEPEPGPEPEPEPDDPIAEVKVNLAVTGNVVVASAEGDLSTLSGYEFSIGSEKTVETGTEGKIDFAELGLEYGEYVVTAVAVSNKGGRSAPSAEEIVCYPQAPAAMTLRFEFSKSGYSPVDAGVGSAGTWKKVDSPTLNVWDWTNEDTDWHEAFKNAFDVNDNLVSVIAAGDTSAVTNMNTMFRGCKSLTSVTSFDTSAVTSMRYTFQGCISLTSVPSFDTSAVTKMGAMLRECSSLTSVPLFDTSAVTEMSSMFYGCTSLTSVPLFDTSAVKNMDGAFQGCISLTSVPSFDTSAVTTMGSMFYGCTSLTSVPLFDTSAVTTMYSMFYGCTSLTSVPLFDTSAVKKMGGAFQDCTKVESGALALYQQVSTQTPPPSHSNTFTDCGRNTETGAAELAQIPRDWGGTGGF